MIFSKDLRKYRIKSPKIEWLLRLLPLWFLKKEKRVWNLRSREFATEFLVTKHVFREQNFQGQHVPMPP